MCFTDVEGPECYVEKIRKARKEHKCCECRKPIPKGAEYQYASGVWDHQPAQYKTCLRCVRLREAIIKVELSRGCDHSDAAPGFGDLWLFKNNYDEVFKNEAP